MQVTFTGLDATTPVTAVDEILDKYPWVEFAILVGTQSGRVGYKRFPSLGIIQNWKLTSWCEHRLAIHLCGTYSRCANTVKDPRHTLELVDGFSRVQINGHHYDSSYVIPFAEQANVGRVILQHRRDFNNVPIIHPKIEYLYDKSGGRGIANIRQWPKPIPGKRCGYAGGINIHNISHVLAFVGEHPNSEIWIDMESGIRTWDNWLDIEMVSQICDRIEEAK